MTDNVAAFTEPHQPPAGEVAGYVTIHTAPLVGLGAVEITMRDRQGHVASVAVPPEAWKRMIGDAAGRFARTMRAT